MGWLPCGLCWTGCCWWWPNLLWSPDGLADGLTEAPEEGPDEGPDKGPGEGPTEGLKNERPAEGPDEGPAEGPDEDPAEGPDEDPVEGPDEDPAEGPDEDPAEGPGEGPAEGLNEGPAEGPADIPADGPEEGPSDGPAEGPAWLSKDWRRLCLASVLDDEAEEVDGSDTAWCCRLSPLGPTEGLAEGPAWGESGLCCWALFVVLAWPPRGLGGFDISPCMFIEAATRGCWDCDTSLRLLLLSLGVCTSADEDKICPFPLLLTLLLLLLIPTLADDLAVEAGFWWAMMSELFKLLACNADETLEEVVGIKW